MYWTINAFFNLFGFLLFQGFEDSIRKNRSLMPNWIKYAQWEESQNEYDRQVHV
jgi:hypothetical protein